jgi:signal transduction histidine kinase
MLEVACDNKEAAATLTKKAHQNIEIAITEIRKLSHQLNPSTLEDIGLDDAIKELVDTINLTGTIKVRYSCVGYKAKAEINVKDKVAIYRIVQEQLTNILKHAKATNIEVTLRFELPKVYIRIKDNGVGFDLSKMKKGLGLKSIQNRIDYYNGSMEIQTTPKKGCILIACIHIDR